MFCLVFDTYSLAKTLYKSMGCFSSLENA